jgi:hypothetical protein
VVNASSGRNNTITSATATTQFMLDAMNGNGRQWS